MAVVTLRAPLKDRADGNDRLELPGDSVGEVLRALEARFPKVVGWILDEHGKVRPHVNVFVNGANARKLDGAATAIKDGDEVGIVPAMAGGTR